MCALLLAAGRSAASPLAASAPSVTSGGAATLRFEAEEYALGRPDAPVTVVIYLSTTCAHCAAFARDTWPRIQTELLKPGRVRVLIREAATAPVAVSTAGFLLARCAGADAYWPTVQHLLRDQDTILTAAGLEAAVHREAEIAGLSDDEARLCLSDPDLLDAANARRQAALEAGVDGTPLFLVDGAALRPGDRLAGVIYPGGELSFAQFAAAVARAAKSGPLKGPCPEPALGCSSLPREVRSAP